VERARNWDISVDDGHASARDFDAIPIAVAGVVKLLRDRGILSSEASFGNI
jgi:hypothetical protein